MKSIIALAALIAMGVCFVSAVVSLFSGEILTALGLFLLAAILNGTAKAFGG